MVSRKFPEGSINKAASVTPFEMEMSLARATGCTGFWTELIVVRKNEIIASVLHGCKLFRAIPLATGPKSAFLATDYTVRNVDIKPHTKHSKARCYKSKNYHIGC